MDMTRNSASRSKLGASALYAHPHRFSLGTRFVRSLGSRALGQGVVDLTPMLRQQGAYPLRAHGMPQIAAGSLKSRAPLGIERPRSGTVRTVGIAFDLKADLIRMANLSRRAGELPEDAFEEYDSEATVLALEEALAENGYRTRRLGSGRGFLNQVIDQADDLVFNIAEGFGTRSREAHVPSALEMLGVPYTHSDPLTLALTLDKAMAKRVVASAGVPTPRFAVLESAEDLDRLPLVFPVIAKPLFEGSSMGVRKHSRVTDPYELTALVMQLLADYRQPVLVEEFCSGPEFTVGVLGTGPDARVLGTMEIKPRRCPIEEFVYSLEVKRNYQEEVEYHAPPRREPEMVRAVEEVALAAHRALSCRDVSRVDIRIGDDGEPKFIEVNPLPGLNPITGDLVILADAYGLKYADLIGRIVDGARQRHAI